MSVLKFFICTALFLLFSYLTIILIVLSNIVFWKIGLIGCLMSASGMFLKLIWDQEI